MMQGTTPTIHCDAEDGLCGAWDVDYYSATATTVNGITVTRTERAPGWTSNGLEDFCPEHKPLSRPVEHQQVHRAHDGASECTCGGWVGPMTTLRADDPRSFAAHVDQVSRPGAGGDSDG